MAIVHASLWMNHLKSYLSPIVIRSTLSHDNLSYTLMSFKSFFMSFVYNKSLFWELKKQYIHQNIAKKSVGFCGMFIHYFFTKKERKKEKTKRNVPEKTFSSSLELESVTIWQSKKVMNHFQRYKQAFK